MASTRLANFPCRGRVERCPLVGASLDPAARSSLGSQALRPQPERSISHRGRGAIRAVRRNLLASVNEPMQTPCASPNPDQRSGQGGVTYTAELSCPGITIDFAVTTLSWQRSLSRRGRLSNRRRLRGRGPSELCWYQTCLLRIVSHLGFSGARAAVLGRRDIHCLRRPPLGSRTWRTTPMSHDHRRSERGGSAVGRIPGAARICPLPHGTVRAQ
jgi:hypothetical protein